MFIRSAWVFGAYIWWIIVCVTEWPIFRQISIQNSTLLPNKSGSFLIFLFALPFPSPTASDRLLGAKLCGGRHAEQRRRRWAPGLSRAGYQQRTWHIYSIWSEVGEEGNIKHLACLLIFPSVVFTVRTDSDAWNHAGSVSHTRLPLGSCLVDSSIWPVLDIRWFSLDEKTISIQ